DLKLSFDDLKGIHKYLDKYDEQLFNYNNDLDNELNSLHNEIISNLKTSENNIELDKSSHGSGSSKGIHSGKKPVNQLDVSGGSIKTWESATDAANELGISRSSIVKAAKGKQSVAGGFKWKYV
ncbi:MAG: NUMOD1 domain-containing DNA-binding protein, partial [Clostridia bacterium]